MLTGILSAPGSADSTSRAACHQGVSALQVERFLRTASETRSALLSTAMECSGAWRTAQTICGGRTSEETSTTTTPPRNLTGFLRAMPASITVTPGAGLNTSWHRVLDRDPGLCGRGRAPWEMAFIQMLGAAPTQFLQRWRCRHIGHLSESPSTTGPWMPHALTVLSPRAGGDMHSLQAMGAGTAMFQQVTRLFACPFRILVMLHRQASLRTYCATMALGRNGHLEFDLWT
mmetsp:Transcript_42768/g.118106  ORF Transcript_42768/g.118106 Transcript_42768/m.118106 type:complete len:231 (-) Transcript_42768:353-1045(-)